jgi:SAM-dependent methyltransferase
VSWDYGRLATEVYELDKPVGRSFGALEYYARQLAGVTGRILEPATGTGRVLIPLLEAGFAVEGLDTSPEMLAVCRQHCRDRGLDPVLREADMTALVQPGAPTRRSSAPEVRVRADPFGWLPAPIRSW